MPDLKKKKPENGKLSWCHILIILALGRQRQEDQGVQDQARETLCQRRSQTNNGLAKLSKGLSSVLGKKDTGVGYPKR